MEKLLRAFLCFQYSFQLNLFSMMKKLKISSGNNFHYIEKQLNVINNAGFSEIKTTFRNEKIDFDLFVKLKMYSIFFQLISS